MSALPSRKAAWLAGQAFVAPRYRSMLRREIAPRVLQTDGMWLDIGCGPAPLVADIAPHRCVGLDLDTAAVVCARSTGVPATVGLASALPFVDGAFSGAVAVGLLHHLDDESAGRALEEMQRVIRPGGIAIVFDGVPPRVALCRPIAAALRRSDRGHHFRGVADLHALLVRHGFRPQPPRTYAWTGLEGCWALLIRGSS